MTSVTRDHRGMTLIEIMVAGLILLIALAGIVPFFLTGLSQSSTLRFKSIASNIAREKMEEIRQLDYREIYTEVNRTGDPALGTRTLESLFGTTATARDTSFDIDYDVNVATYEEGYLKEVTVNVTWDAPPRVSAAKLTTLVHQQFLGPRGSLLEVSPTWSDPLGTPFPVIDRDTDSHITTVRYHIAQADWALVFDHLDTTPVAKNVYMRLALYDDNGQCISLGDPAKSYEIDKTHLRTTVSDGRITDVWFEYQFRPDTIPDGYWEMRAVACNIYGEPGNVWRLRVRTEKGAPATPTDLFGVAQADNQTVVLTWAGGPERDRDHYVLQRRLWDGADWLGWVTVSDRIAPHISTYTDVGSVAHARDPWGDAANEHYYEYQLWAEDSNRPANAGGAVVSPAVVIPAPVVETTVPTTLPSTTETTAPPATPSDVEIKNLSASNYDLTITTSSGTRFGSVIRVAKNKTVTVTGLPAGSYLVQAVDVANQRPTITQSFTVPQQAGSVVLTIL